MKAEVSIIEHSISAEGKPLISFVAKYNRFIHAELLTHRVFSRSSASSRAIPTKTFISRIRETPAMPLYFGVNQKGMQAGEEVTPEEIEEIKTIWLEAMEAGISFAERIAEKKMHKQLVNRLLEPWMRMDTIITTTNWANFEALRNHKDAQPEARDLCQAMLEAKQNSTPKLLKEGEWHLPFVLPEERETYHIKNQLQMSTARCARVSYTNHGTNKISMMDDLVLFNDLATSQPVHASPTEHQGSPDKIVGSTIIGYEDDMQQVPVTTSLWNKGHLHGNFSGWIQHRKTIKGETVLDPFYSE